MVGSPKPVFGIPGESALRVICAESMAPHHRLRREGVAPVLRPRQPPAPAPTPATARSGGAGPGGGAHGPAGPRLRPWGGPVGARTFLQFGRGRVGRWLRREHRGVPPGLGNGVAGRRPVQSSAPSRAASREVPWECVGAAVFVQHICTICICAHTYIHVHICAHTYAQIRSPKPCPGSPEGAPQGEGQSHPAVARLRCPTLGDEDVTPLKAQLVSYMDEGLGQASLGAQQCSGVNGGHGCGQPRTSEGKGTLRTRRKEGRPAR